MEIYLASCEPVSGGGVAPAQRPLLLDMRVIFADVLAYLRGRAVCAEGGFRMANFTVCLTRSVDSFGDPVVHLAVPVLDDYLRFFRCRHGRVRCWRMPMT